MGTHSLINFYDGDISPDNLLVSVYQQYDGFPRGVGQEIVDFFKGKAVKNGFSPDDTMEKAMNGMGCGAAAFIAKHKTGIGGLYINRPGSKGCGEDFVYDVFLKKERTVQVRVTAKGYGATPDKVLYDGDVAKADMLSLEKE